jgi:hypothetical protein
LVILLFIADPILAMVVTLALGGGYVFIYATARRYLAHIGEERRQADRRLIGQGEEGQGEGSGSRNGPVEVEA